MSVIIQALIVAAVRCWYCYGWAKHAFEDAYINFRIASNWLTVGAPQYNAGENVMAGTSALWLVVTAGAQWLVGAWNDPSHVMFALAIGLDVTTHRMGLRLMPGAYGRWLWTLGFAFLPVFLLAAGYGLETNAVMLLIVSAVTLGERGRWVSLALLAMIRPDTPAYALPLALVLPGRGRNLLAVAAGVGAQCAVNLALWGVVVPQSVTAKKLVYGVHPFKGHAFIDWFLPWSNQYFAEAAPMACLAAAWIPALVAVKDRRVWALLAAGLTMCLVQLVMAPMAFRWYVTASVLCMLLVACHAFSVFYAGRARWLVAACMVVALSDVARVMSEDKRRLAIEEVYIGAGQWARERVEAGATVLLEPAGIAPYIFRHRVMDEVGIVSPEIAVDRAARSDGWMYRAIMEHKPDLVLSRHGNVAMNIPLGGIGKPFVDEEQLKRMLDRYEVETSFRAADGSGVPDVRGLIYALVRK